MKTDLLSTLNPQQRAAVQTVDGPLLILAGAGTGKTRTLVHRLAYLVSEARIPSEKLLAITFTKKAADEMRERVAALCRQGINLSSLWIGTIHALCHHILQHDGRDLNIVPDFEIIPASNQAGIIRDLVPRFFPEQTSISVKQFALQLSREKNELAAHLCNAGQSSAAQHLSAFCQEYQKLLVAAGLLDFDDLIIETLLLIIRFPRVAEKLRQQFTHIAVDEFQDINSSQYLLIREIAGPQPNLCAVGDADQAIYAFRGSQVKIFSNFQQDFPAATVITLEENYRSTRTIINAAQNVIEKNLERVEKKLKPLKPAGERIEICEMHDEWEEARFVAQEIGRLLGGTRFETLNHARRDAELPALGFSDIAVLYRLHAQCRPLKKFLSQAGIPVQVVTGLSLYEEPEVKPVIDFLEMLYNPENNFAAGEVLQNTVKGLGPKTIQNLRDRAEELDISLIDLIRGKTTADVIAADTPAEFDSFCMLFDDLLEKSRRMPLDQLIQKLYEQLFMRSTVSTDQGNHYTDNENLLDLITASMPFAAVPAVEGIPLFLEKVNQVREGEAGYSQQEAVTLLTVHGAKGLEFPVVFMIGLEEGLFPCLLNNSPDKNPDLEEERRLFYVGMTRAKEKLYLTYAHNRFLFGECRGMPCSKFLEDIPDELVTHYTDHEITRKLREKHKPKQMSLFTK